ncbi:MAG: hypothetical protein ACRBG0_18660 [Lewinella sp.]|jgi:hypothetical protein|uniref:hypothetical protein n=1 Tax=Lewinella sp. TaxID=2004506 RepID=UPI003D6B613E
MRSKDHLFHLIKSLSKSEKRYFTLDAKKSGRKQSRYLTLFKTINDQEEFSEKPLKKLFGSKLGDDKARLYEAILRSMRDYQSKKSYKTRIKELLTDAKILFERKLYEQAENRLSEAKDLALELEDHLAVLEINLRQRQLMRGSLDRDYQEQVKELTREKDYHIEILTKEFWLHDNYDQLSVKYLKYPYKLNDKEVAELTTTYHDLLETKPADLDSFTSLWRYHKFMSLYYRLTGETEKVLYNFQEIVNIWEDHPKKKAEEFVTYIGDASNLLSTLLNSAERVKKELPQRIEKLQRQDIPNKQGEKLLFERTSLYQLLFLINTPGEEIEGPIEHISKGLQQFELNPSTQFSILSNVVLLLFLNDRYTECLSRLKDVSRLQKKYGNIREDIQDISIVIKLLATYKLEEFDSIDNTLRSTRRYFIKRSNSKLLAFFELTAGTIQKLQTESSLKSEKVVLNQFIEKITNGPKNTIGGLDEIALLWANSIINNTTITKERASKK